MRLRSHAKVNLYLRIVGLRPDGYHDLETLFAAISIGDEINLEPIGKGIEILCNDPFVPTNSKNLCWRAAETLAARAGVSRGVRIMLNKDVPPGSGLGGGSSNAAATLVGLNELWETGLSEIELREIGAELGADVPFFILGGLCIARGTGEILTPLTVLPELWITLIRPPVSVSTPRAYKAFDALPTTPTTPPISDLVELLAQSPQEIASRLANDLEAAVLPAYPEVRSAKKDLIAAGALGALMSGSGSAVFGVARDEAHAEELARILAGKYPWVRTGRVVRDGIEVAPK